MATVMDFKIYDISQDEVVRAACKMSRENIKAWGGVPIEGTQEEVPDQQLDVNGRYYPDVGAVS